MGTVVPVCPPVAPGPLPPVFARPPVEEMPPAPMPASGDEAAPPVARAPPVLTGETPEPPVLEPPVPPGAGALPPVPVGSAPVPPEPVEARPPVPVAPPVDELVLGSALTEEPPQPTATRMARIAILGARGTEWGAAVAPATAGESAPRPPRSVVAIRVTGSIFGSSGRAAPVAGRVVNRTKIPVSVVRTNEGPSSHRPRSPRAEASLHRPRAARRSVPMRWVSPAHRGSVGALPHAANPQAQPAWRRGFPLESDSIVGYPSRGRGAGLPCQVGRMSSLLPARMRALK